MAGISIADITIRTNLLPGDLGYVAYLHGLLYAREYGYGASFESYVARALAEFNDVYHPDRSRVWIAEHKGDMIGFLALMDRGESAQLRFFLIEPDYRGIGLGKVLMEQYMEALVSIGYTSSYLLTTDELPAAASLYKRNGFRLTDERESAAFGKQVREQRYDLLLRQQRPQTLTP